MKTIELVADEAHEVWSNWMRYLFSKCSVTVNGELVIPKDLEERWARQMDTPYDNLSEKEKDSDRAIAEKYMKIILTPSSNNEKKDVRA